MRDQTYSDRCPKVDPESGLRCDCAMAPGEPHPHGGEHRAVKRNSACIPEYAARWVDAATFLGSARERVAGWNGPVTCGGRP